MGRRYEPEYALSDRDNGTKTRYLLIKPTGPIIVGVDEAINDHEQADDTCGTYLITSDGHVISANIEDYQPYWDDWNRKRRGWHFQISEWREDFEGPLLEEVVYVDSDREYHERRIVLVDGFDHEITDDE